MTASEEQNILVIKLSALGDFIQALGPMAAIRKHHKDARITLLTTRPYESFGQNCGYFDEVWIDDKPRWLNLIGWQNLKNKLKSGNFSRIYDLQNNDRTSLYFKLLSGKDTPEWVGAAKGASHSNQSPDRTKGHAIDGHKQTLALAGIKNVTIDTLDWMQADIASFPLKKPFILIVPGSAPTRPEKRWPESHYARLCHMIHGWGYQPVLLGTRAEQKTIDDIIRACPEALDLSQQTSFEHLASLGRAAAAAVGNDTGPMHLIAATGCPTFAIFSKHSDPVKHKPLGENVTLLEADNLDDLKAEDVLKRLQPKKETEKQIQTMH